MELDYPSERDHGLDLQLKQIDRRYGSLLFNNPIIDQLQRELHISIKKQIIELIIKDNLNKLISTMKDKAIKLTDQLSKKGLGWNVLHYIAKYNAHRCLELCLRVCYQEDPNLYKKSVDSKTIDGDTPLIIAFQNKSNSVIKILLEYGGLDIYAINNKKMTAYQTALSNQNEEGLQFLMKYELKIKEKQFINVSVLSEPVEIQNQRKCDSLLKCLYSCFSFGTSQKSTSSSESEKEETETDRKMVMRTSNSSIGVLQVIWKQPITASGSIIPLFTQQINPFSIKQNSIVVTNLLVFFQCLAQYTQLLKNVIFKADEKYYVKFSTSKGQKIVWMDNLFPYMNHNEEPLFLCLNDQVWPMVLQKALSQHYGGYFQPGKVSFNKLFQVVTGNYSYKVNIPKTKSEDNFIDFLKKLEKNNCMYVLSPREDCEIKCPENRKECFSVLKILQNKILINCPFVTEEEKLRQSKDSIQMKIQKAHYNNPNTMAIWITQEELYSFFEELIFCYTSPTIKTHEVEPYLTMNRFYAKFKIKKFRSGEKIYVQVKDKNNETITPQKVSGWTVLGNHKKKVQKLSTNILGRVALETEKICDQVILEMRFALGDQLENQQVKMKYSTQHKVEVEVLDGIIGDLEYIEYCKSYFNSFYVRYEAPIIQQIGDYVLIMAGTNNPCYILSENTVDEDKIIQGILTDNNTKIQMFNFDNISFAVMTNISSEEIEKMKVISLEEVQETEQDYQQ